VAIRVLIVDDHSVVREGLRTFLRRDAELEVVGEAEDGTEAVEKARQLRPNVVLMDLLLPGMDGIEATSIIHREMPETKVVVLTSGLAGSSVLHVLQAGATSYMRKDTRGPEMRATIKAAAAGQLLLSPKVSTELMEEMRAPGPAEQLTRREKEVLQLLSQGHSNKDIAQSLSVAEDTVKTHIRHILEKLGVQSRTQAIVAAMRLGMIAAKEPVLSQ
jgi:two-component system, NarL family, response regulator LiaR